MRRPRVEVVVAGHICLDILPKFVARHDGLATILAPGKVTTVGPVTLATGGAVANVGLALFRLGVAVRLMGKIGDDLLGRAILDTLRGYDPALVEGMIVGKDEHSSYTVVINPPGVDRLFLHCPGANDTFCDQDVQTDQLQGARVFHFGYPPLMRCMYTTGGVELRALMQRAKKNGLMTSLDMAYPDANSAAGRVDWVALLERVLPHVDLFLPSLDEILLLLEHPVPCEAREGGSERVVEGALLDEVAGRLLDMGVAIVVLKLGHQGLYLRTTSNPRRLLALGGDVPGGVTTWLGRELLAPCFKTDVVGTTGAGDCTIAGFIAGWLKGLSLEEVMTGTVAVGAYSVETLDATAGIPDWDSVQARIRAGWERHEVTLSLERWRWNGAAAIWVGPHDKARYNGAKHS